MVLGQDSASIAHYAFASKVVTAEKLEQTIEENAPDWMLTCACKSCLGIKLHIHHAQASPADRAKEAH